MSLDREKLDAAARKYAARGKYASALTEYEKLLADRPHDARTVHDAADVQLRMKSYADAIASYERAGNLFELEGNAPRATLELEQVRLLLRAHAPELCTQYVRVWTKLIAVHVAAKRIPQATDLLREACGIFEEQCSHAELIEARQRLVSLDPRAPRRLVDLADAFLRGCEPREAAASLLVAAKLLAARRHTEDGEAALVALERCACAAPDDLDVLALVAQAFAILGRRDRSIETRLEMERVAGESGEVARCDELLRGLPDPDGADDDFEPVSEIELVVDAPASGIAVADHLARTATASFDLEAALDRADAYIEHGMVDEARALIYSQLEHVPGNVLLLERLLDIDDLEIRAARAGGHAHAHAARAQNA